MNILMSSRDELTECDRKGAHIIMSLMNGQLGFDGHRLLST